MAEVETASSSDVNTTTTTTTTNTTSTANGTATSTSNGTKLAHGLPMIDPQPQHAEDGQLLDPIPMPATIVDGFDYTVQRFPHNLAIQVKRGGQWKKWTWTKYREEIYSAAKSFIKLGMKEGSGVNIIGFNSPEWHMAHLGTIYAGGLPTGIYTTSSTQQCEYFAEHSEAMFVVVENEQQLAKYTPVREKLTNVRYYIIMEPSDPAATHPEGTYTWEQFMELGRPIPDTEIDRISKNIKPDNLCTLIYTSGTTGMPKGCMITQRNVAWTVHTLGSIVLSPKTGHRERMISYLPLSHVAEQVVSLYAPLVFGFSVSFADKNALQGTLLDTLLEVKPTVFFGVPRVWEKIQLKINTVMATKKGVSKKLVGWAKNKGLEGGYKIQRGEKKPKGYGLARTLVFKKILKTLGFSSCRFMASTAAPISKDTLDFFLSLGITISEAYGMSELTGPQTIGYPKAKTGSVGRSLPGSLIKLNQGDAEICIKGPNCFAGYYKNPEATREIIDEDGWLHTGDIGHIDEAGYLFITDRKKELIITAGGENISPSLLEGYLRQIPGVNMAVVVGDRQKYLVCLFSLNVDYFKRLQYGHAPPVTLEDAINDQHFNEYLQSKINEVNSRLPNVSTIKKYKICPNEFTDQGPDAELTPTQKLKRKVILAKFDTLVREMYGDQYAEGAFTQAPTSLVQSTAVDPNHKSKSDAIPPVAAAAVAVPVVAVAATTVITAENQSHENHSSTTTETNPTPVESAPVAVVEKPVVLEEAPIPAYQPLGETGVFHRAALEKPKEENSPEPVPDHPAPASSVIIDSPPATIPHTVEVVPVEPTPAPVEPAPVAAVEPTPAPVAPVEPTPVLEANVVVIDSPPQPLTDHVEIAPVPTKVEDAPIVGAIPEVVVSDRQQAPKEEPNGDDKNDSESTSDSDETTSSDYSTSTSDSDSEETSDSDDYSTTSDETDEQDEKPKEGN